MSVSTTTVRARTATAWQGSLLLAGSCMPVLGAVLITPVLPQVSEHFADVPGSDVLVPMIVTVPALLIAVCAPFAGQIVDRVGRKIMLIVAMIAYALVGVAPVWLDSLQAILVSRALVGLCEAAIMTVCTSLIVDYFQGRRRDRYLGLQTLVTSIAATVFIAVGGVLGVGGWRAPFWLYALSIVVAVPMLFALWEPHTAAADLDAERVRTPTPWRRIWLSLVVAVFGGFTFYVMVVETSYLVVGAGVPATQTGTIGGVATLVSLAMAVGAFVFPWLARWGVRTLLPIAFGAQAIGMILVWLAPSLTLLVVGAVVASLGSGVLLPSLLTWVVSHTRFDERGRVTGWFIASFYFGQFVTPLVVAAVAAPVGGLTAGIGVVGVVAAVVAAVLGVFLRGTRPIVGQA